MKKAIKTKFPFLLDMKRSVHVAVNSFYRKQNVALLHFGRCGSTVLGSMLQQHPSIYWGGEIFEPYMKKRNETGLKFAASEIELNRSFGISKVYGFETKTLPHQHLSSVCINSNLPEYVELLKRSGFTKFITLHRENYLRWLVSALVAEKTKLWHVKASNLQPKVTQVEIEDVYELASWKGTVLEMFQAMDDVREQTSSLLSEALPLSYEDDLETDPLKAYTKICDYLNLKPVTADVKLRRTNPFKLSQLISNVDDVHEMLRGTKYEWMITD